MLVCPSFWIASANLCGRPFFSRRSCYALQRDRTVCEGAMSTRTPQVDSTHALDIPPTVLLGARVEHILVEEPGLLSSTIADALSLPQVQSCMLVLASCPLQPHADGLNGVMLCHTQNFARELIRFGAVHWCPVLPGTYAHVEADAQHAERALAARKAAVELLGPRVRPEKLLCRVCIQESAFASGCELSPDACTAGA